MKKFFLAMVVIMGTLLWANGPKTNTEKVLEWQDNSDVSTVKLNWQESIEYCEALTLSEHTDWRVPNINELKSIIDRNRATPSLLSTFNYIGSDNDFGYWSSTSFKGEESKAWYILFGYGYSYSSSKIEENYIRCVRNKK